LTNRVGYRHMSWFFQGRLTRFEVRGVIPENLAKQHILIFYAKSKHKVTDLGKSMRHM